VTEFIGIYTKIPRTNDGGINNSLMTANALNDSLRSLAAHWANWIAPNPWVRKQPKPRVSIRSLLAQ
jgi:hypothetical protein